MEDICNISASAMRALDALDVHMAEFYISEGYTAQDRVQTGFFVDLVHSFAPKKILEIGFNSGHSSTSLLIASAANSEVVSFDLGEHYYVDHAKAFVDARFPGRHTLIKGNSVETVAKYADEHRGDAPFDLMFVDGGHFGDIPLRDCINCMRLVHDNTILIIDDIVITNRQRIQTWNHAPNYAWSLLCETGYVIPIDRKEFVEDRPNDGRGFAWGRFNSKKISAESSEYKRYKLLFKNQNRDTLANSMTHFYSLRDRLHLGAVAETYLDYFENDSERETQLAKFYKGFALAYLDYDEAVASYENLLRIPNVAEDLQFFTNCNLPQLYIRSPATEIPKIIHLLYFGETEFHNFHDRCVRSMLFHMRDYRVVIYNNVEPSDNAFWNKLKTHPRVTIEHIDVPTHFDGYELGHFQYKADVVRLEVLYKHGGVYLDLDMLIVRDFSEVFNTGKDLYLSREGDNPGLINAFIAAKPKNEFLKIWLDNFKTGLRMGVWAYHIRDTNRLLIEKHPYYESKFGIEILHHEKFFPVPWTARDVFNGERKFEFNNKHYGVHLFETILFDVVKRNDFFDYLQDVNIDSQYQVDTNVDTVNKVDKPEIMKIVNEIVVLTTDKRSDRESNISEHLNSRGIPFTILRSKMHAKPVIGCIEAHINAIRRAKARNYDAIMICEDDIVVTDRFANFRANSVPKEWDMLYFGGILTHMLDGRTVDWVRGVIWCNHAYVVKRHMYDLILDYYATYSNQPTEIQSNGTVIEPTIATDHMFTDHFHTKYKCWLAIDQYIVQREDFSNIDNRVKWANNFDWGTFTMKYI
jgi:predicted O-methyltransferase YrrM/mannosyltransferase OCH1-like enzyme/GR25 family glycosyltransferase involved in LPS biosynthesis